VVFGYIAAHVQDNIGVSKINVVICHGAATVRLCQSRYRSAVSDTGLVFNVYQA